ncbi:MAG: methionyl-tRNA formyltransferase [Bacteroidetes bacterium]|nr:methionyl-tRNA formyltransferase [Bacteroidota bacterium]
MRIIFMGTPEFAVPSLRILLEHSYEIPAVVTAPDKPRGRGQQVSFTSVKEFALKKNIPVMQPDKLNDASFSAEIKKLRPDIIVVVAFRILPREVYGIPKLGSFNLHASLLPKYRGAAPINWAIIKGEKESGVTTFFLNDEVDTGSIILQKRIPIGPDDNAGLLHDALSAAGAEAVLQTVRLIESGQAHPQAQDNSLACPAPKIFKEGCRIDWTGTTQQVHDFIRGLSPYPAAWTTHMNKQIRIFRTSIISKESSNAGIILERTKDKLEVGTGSGTVALLELQQEGKRRLDIEEFLRGYSIEPGDKLI